MVFPKEPTLLTLQESLNQPIEFEKIGFTLNGIPIRSPYRKANCCDATFTRADTQVTYQIELNPSYTSASKPEISL